MADPAQLTKSIADTIGINATEGQPPRRINATASPIFHLSVKIWQTLTRKTKGRLEEPGEICILVLSGGGFLIFTSNADKRYARRRSRGVELEALEGRCLASASYVRVGQKIQPNMHKGVASYFSKNLPAGDYMIVVAGGSMTYYDGASPPTYQLNDYNIGDYGFKVIEPGVKRFAAPGLSVPRKNSKVAAADSLGVCLKFRHSTAGRIGIELYDKPYGDNLAGADGAPAFILRERMVTTQPTVAISVRAALIRSTSTTFSSITITSDPDATPADKLDSLT